MESLFWCLIAFLAVAAMLLGVVIVASIIGASVGSLGQTVRRWLPASKRPWLTWLLGAEAAICASILAAIGFSVWQSDRFFSGRTINYSLTATADAPLKFLASDPRMQPFTAALNVADRARFGFTPIPPSARVEVRSGLGSPRVDVIVIVYAESMHTIFLRREGLGYVWLGENETFTGPHVMATDIGDFTEQIQIVYNTPSLSGKPEPTYVILYRGEDPRLTEPDPLTLVDIAPVLAEWRTLRKTPSPPPGN
jgi:hypothetical protein